MSREPGPFSEYYYCELYKGTTGATIRASVGEIQPHLTVLSQVSGDLNHERETLEAVVDGAPQEGTVANVRTVIETVDGLSASACYGIAVLGKFATDVDTYDDEVEACNRTFNTQKAGLTPLVDEPLLGPIYDPADLAKLKAPLLKKVMAAEAQLETDAALAVTMLDAGPGGEYAKDLMLWGFLPLSSEHFWPSITFTPDERALLQALDPPSLGTTTSPELLAQLNLVRDAELDPSVYADLLRSYWQTVTLENAAIDFRKWDISRGAGELEGIIEAVYNYYGSIYQQNPRLEWAGLANLVGPSFAAGFLDLGMMGTAIDVAEGPLGQIPDELRERLGGPAVESRRPRRRRDRVLRDPVPQHAAADLPRHGVDEHRLPRRRHGRDQRDGRGRDI